MTSSGVKSRPHVGDLSAEEILERCTHRCVPANCNVSAAVSAHRSAFALFQQDPACEDLAMLTLRAILLAVSHTADDDGTKHSYLSSLPDAAWESNSIHTSVQMREPTLATIRRQLTYWPSQKAA